MSRWIYIAQHNSQDKSFVIRNFSILRTLGVINLRFQVRRGYLVPFSSPRQHIRITIPVTLFRDQSRGNSKVRSVARPLRASVTSGRRRARIASRTCDTHAIASYRDRFAS